MSSKTKIVVLKSKELIYTGIFVVLGILLILLLFYMFSPGDNKAKKKADSASQEQNIQTDNLSTEAIPNDVTDTFPEETQTTEAALEETAETFAGYIPGVYTSELNLGGSTLLLSVTVDENQVTGVTLDNMDETLTAMYPLVQPSLDEINSQIGMVSSVDDITYSSDNKYTTILILEAIEDALSDAKK